MCVCSTHSSGKHNSHVHSASLPRPLARSPAFAAVIKVRAHLLVNTNLLAAATYGSAPADSHARERIKANKFASVVEFQLTVPDRMLFSGPAADSMHLQEEKKETVKFLTAEINAILFKKYIECYPTRIFVCLPIFAFHDDVNYFKVSQ